MSGQIIVDDWYDRSGAPLSEFQLNDGTKLDSQLNQLVSAMATFTSNNPGFDPSVAGQMPTDANLQNAIAASAPNRRQMDFRARPIPPPAAQPAAYSD